MARSTKFAYSMLLWITGNVTTEWDWCDFLLVVSSNWVFISYGLQHVAAFQCENTTFPFIYRYG